jgi:hypothetical protein
MESRPRSSGGLPMTQLFRFSFCACPSSRNSRGAKEGAAQRLERLTAAAFRDAAERMIREDDEQGFKNPSALQDS